ncbi:MAG: DUF423 domain-containing protein [Saprospiraceae bacterium]
MANQELTGHFQHKTNNWLLFIGLSGALAVALGAFGAHALEGQLSPKRIETFTTASFYHFVHTLVLLAVYLLGEVKGWTPKLIWAGKSFGIGLFVFCGSLYVLATRGLIGAESASWLGAITPIGGVAFIAGWILLGMSQRSNSNK